MRIFLRRYKGLNLTTHSYRADSEAESFAELQLLHISTSQPHKEASRSQIVLSKARTLRLSMFMEIAGDIIILLMTSQRVMGILDRFYVWNWRTGILIAVRALNRQVIMTSSCHTERCSTPMHILGLHVLDNGFFHHP